MKLRFGHRTICIKMTSFFPDLEMVQFYNFLDLNSIKSSNAMFYILLLVLIKHEKH